MDDHTPTIQAATFTGHGSQQRAFDSAEDALVFASDLGKAKQYHVCADYDALYEYVFAQPAERRCYYEMIRPHMAVKLYFDLELEVGDGLVERMDALQARLVEFVNNKLVEKYDRVLERDDVLVLHSDGPTKASRHVIWPVYFDSVVDVKAFVHSHVAPHFPEGLDKGVYTKNRCFRLFGNRKLGSKRVLSSGKSNGSESTNRKLFQSSLLTIPPQNEALVLECNDDTNPPTRLQKKRKARRKRSRTPASAATEAALANTTAWVTDIVREREDVAAPTVRRVRDAVYQWTFVRTSHKRKCRLGGLHKHQNMAVNIDLAKGTVFYKCYGECGHPITAEGDTLQSMRLHDLPEELRERSDPVVNETGAKGKFNVLMDHALRGDVGFAELYTTLSGRKNLIITSKGGDGYLWSEELRLWQSVPPICIINNIQRVLLEEFTDANNAIVDELSEDDAKMPSGKLVRAISIIGRHHNLKGTLHQLCDILYDKTFDDRIDASPYELPLNGGLVIDFNTLEVRQRTQTDLWSWESKAIYRPDSDCEVATAVLREVADVHAHPERGNYDECIQVMLGSLLCANKGAKAMPQLHGTSGNNMKSELVQILKRCVPETFTSIDDSVLTSSKASTGGPDPLLVQLKGKRVAVMGDTGKSIILNTTNVKRITGGDDFAARKLHSNGGDMSCVCKPVVCTNHPIPFDVTQGPMIERVGNHYYPFTHQFMKTKAGDAKCKAYRTTYLDEFFTHFIRGANVYAKTGGPITNDWLDNARADYMQSINPVGCFVEDDCVKDGNAKIYSSTLYDAYGDWVSRNNENALSAKVFGERMTAMFGKSRPLKVNLTDIKRNRGYVGVRLKLP